MNRQPLTITLFCPTETDASEYLAKVTWQRYGDVIVAYSPPDRHGMRNPLVQIRAIAHDEPQGRCLTTIVFDDFYE